MTLPLPRRDAGIAENRVAGKRTKESKEGEKIRCQKTHLTDISTPQRPTQSIVGSGVFVN